MPAGRLGMLVNKMIDPQEKVKDIDLLRNKALAKSPLWYVFNSLYGGRHVV